MAFTLKNLQPVGGTARGGTGQPLDPGKNAKAYWSYSEFNSTSAISSAGYFNEVRDLLNPNDAMLIIGSGVSLRWTSILASPKSPSTANVTMSPLNQDSA